MSFQSATIATGTLNLQVNISSPSQIEVSGVSGNTVLLKSSTGLVTERTITADTTFKSDMEDMLFVLSAGTGPVVIGVNPMKGNRTAGGFTMVVT